MSGVQAQPLQHDPNAHSGGVGEYLLHRAKPYLPPWLMAGGVGVLPSHHTSWVRSL